MQNVFCKTFGKGVVCWVVMVLICGTAGIGQAEEGRAFAVAQTISTEATVREHLAAKQWRQAMIAAQQAREVLERHQLGLIVTEEQVRLGYFADAIDNLRYVDNYETKAMAFLMIAQGQADNGTALAYESLRKAVKAAKKIEDAAKRQAMLERLSKVKLDIDPP